MPDEISQLASEPTLPETSVSEPNPVPVSPDEPMPDAPTPSTDSMPAEVPPEAPQATLSPKEVAPVKDGISANEPFENTPDSAKATSREQGKPPELTSEPLEKPGITIEKHGTDTTITEVMEPMAQMAGNEPFDSAQDKPIDLTEEIKTKQRQENLKLANENRQEKKREKVDKILEMFSGQKEISNDEVEKILHVSDATATRYLEILEQEGKIKQVGKTGKGVKYEKV